MLAPGAGAPLPRRAHSDMCSERLIVFADWQVKKLEMEAPLTPRESQISISGPSQTSASGPLG
jgi:hypothetical protein